MTSDLFRFAAPQAFFPLAGKLIPWFSVLAGVLALAGLYVAFFVAPTDHQRDERVLLAAAWHRLQRLECRHPIVLHLQRIFGFSGLREAIEALKIATLGGGAHVGS